MAAKENTKRKGHQTSTRPNKKPKDGENKTSSSQKRELKKERQSHRRHAELVSEAKSLWNKLRMKSNTAEETKDLTDRTMKLIVGKVNEIALQHDASRVVQAVVQFGSDEQRKQVLTEICATQAALPELSKIQYAHFLCLKLIKYCAKDDECVKMIVKSFKGTMPKLAVHSVGSRVVESLFLNFPSKETAALKIEFFGPHVSLFSRDFSGVPSLKSSLDSATTEKQKEAAIAFVKDIISKGTNKSLFGMTFFQDILAEYIEVVDGSEIRELASSIADHSIHLLSTRAGTRVIANIASFGTPKDRKRICKSLKGYTSSSLLHKDAYLAVIRLIQVTDDTVSIHKSILNELLTAPQDESSGTTKSPLLSLALSDTASKLFLFFLPDDDGPRMKYFDPYERSILEPIPEIKGACTYKKDPTARREEIVGHLRQALVDLCINHTETLMRSLPGSRVLKEVYHTCACQELVDAIISVCESALDSVSDEATISLFEHPTGHWAIKHLAICDSESELPIFSEAFFNRFEKRLVDVAKSNRGAFVLAAFLKVEKVRQRFSKALGSRKKAIKKLSTESEATAGYEALLKEI